MNQPAKRKGAESGTATAVPASATGVQIVKVKPDETGATCPEDCPCGDGVCAVTETHASCPADCAAGCGDGVCSAAEGTGAGGAGSVVPPVGA